MTAAPWAYHGPAIEPNQAGILSLDPDPGLARGAARASRCGRLRCARSPRRPAGIPGYQNQWPAFTSRDCPVIARDMSDAKNTALSAISSEVGMCLSAVCPATES